MTTKNVTIEFYTGQVGADGQAGLVSSLLGELADREQCQVVNIGNRSYEIRDLVSLNRGASFKGVFAKFRTDNIPHAGTPGGDERALDLEEDEGLVEKNYFLYFRTHELLVYQRNGHGSTTNRMGRYFTDIAGETVIFNPVLQEEPMRRLLNGDVDVRSLDLSFAKPTNPDLYPGNNWNTGLLRVLTESGGVRMSLHISGDARSKQPGQRFLARRLKRAVTQLMNDIDVRKAKFQVEEDGVKHPIDLIADRLLAQQDVTMIEHYPDPESMYAALRSARDENRQVLREYFGDPENAVN